MSWPRGPIHNYGTRNDQRSPYNNNPGRNQEQNQGGSTRFYDVLEQQYQQQYQQQPPPIIPEQPGQSSRQSTQRPYEDGNRKSRGKWSEPGGKRNFNTYRYPNNDYRRHENNNKRQRWSSKENPTISSNNEESDSSSTSNEMRKTRAETLNMLDADMEAARLKAETDKAEISLQADKDVKNFKADLTWTSKPNTGEYDLGRSEAEIENMIWKGTTVADPNEDSEPYIKTSDLEIIVEAIAEFLSELPQNAEPDKNELYKGSRDKFLQKLVGLRQEQEEIKLEAVNAKLGNLMTRSSIAELGYKTQKNHNDIKTMKRKNCTKSQTHSIVRNEMEDGRVIILRRLFGKNLQAYLTWCSEKHNARTQKAFNYLIERKEYDLNSVEINLNNEETNEHDLEQSRRDFWDRADSILRGAVPVTLHRNVKLGGNTCDAKDFEGEEINTDVKLIFEDRRDARWVHDLYCNQLGNGNALNKPPMIYEGKDNAMMLQDRDTF